MSFSKNSNFNEKANFTGVKFGENKPVLEVELNELQDIQNQHREDLVRDIVLNGFTALTNIEVSTNGVKFLEETVVYVNGFRLIIPKNRIIALPSISRRKRSATINNITLEVWEDTLLSIDTLHEYGGDGNNDIPNHIIDSRYPVETTRRRGIRYKFSVDSEEVVTPVDGTDLSKYETGGKTVYVLPIFNVTRTADTVEYTDLRKLVQPNDIKARVEKLEDVEPLMQEYTGSNHITVDGSFEDITKNLVIKGKTLNNLVDRKGTQLMILEGDKYVNPENNIGGGILLITPTAKENTLYTLVYKVLRNSKDIKLQFDGHVNYIAKPKKLTATEGYHKIVFSTKESFEGASSDNTIKIQVWAEDNTGEKGSISIHKDIMVLEGDYTNKPIPNTYFDSITSAGEQEDNKIKIKSVGKNLFDEQFEQGRWYYTKGSKLVKVTSPTGFRCANPIKILPNTKYVTDFKNNNTSGYFILTDSQMIITRTINFGVMNNSKTIVTTNEEHYLAFYSVDESTRGYEITQIEENTIATNCEQYREDIKEIKIPFENGLKGLPNGVCDELREKEIIQRVGKVVLNGSENWVKGSWNNANIISFDLTNLKNFKSCYSENNRICDKFLSLSRTAIPSDINLIVECITGGENAIYLAINKTKLGSQDVVGLKTYLKNNPITLYYELIEPVIHKLHEDYNLETYKDVTHIMQENNICGDISFEVSKDRNALILSNTKEIKKTKEMLETTFDYLGGKIPVYVPVNVKEPVTVNDCMLGEVKDVEIEGMTLQNLKSLTVGITGNAVLSNNGDVYRATSNSSSASGYLGFPVNPHYSFLKPNTTYTMFTSNYAQNGANNSKVSLHTRNTNVQNEFVRIRDNVFKVTTTEIDYENEIRVLFYCGTSGYVEVNKKIVLLEGDWTDYDLPYFEEIISLGQENNSINFKTTGKNLVKEVLYSKGIDTATGNLGSGTNNVIDLIKVIPNTTYSFSKDGVARAVNKFYYDVNKEYIGRSNETNSTFVIPPKCHYIRLTFGNTTPEYNLQLEIGNKVSDFEDYKVDTCSIPLPIEGGLKSLPNGVKDIYKNGLVIQNLTKMSIPHTYDFIHYVNAPNQINTICFYMTTTILDTAWGTDWNNLYCNKFMNGPIWDNDIEGIAIDSKNKLLIRIKRSRLSSLDNAGLKQWLQNNELYIICKWKEPKIYEVEGLQHLNIFDGLTHIQQNNNINANVEMLVPVSLNKSLGRTAEENKELRSNLNTIKEGTLLLTSSMRNFMEVMMLPSEGEDSKNNAFLKSLADLEETLQNM